MTWTLMILGIIAIILPKGADLLLRKQQNKEFQKAFETFTLFIDYKKPFRYLSKKSIFTNWSFIAFGGAFQFFGISVILLTSITIDIKTLTVSPLPFEQFKWFAALVSTITFIFCFTTSIVGMIQRVQTKLGTHIYLILAFLFIAVYKTFSFNIFTIQLKLLISIIVIIHYLNTGEIICCYELGKINCDLDILHSSNVWSQLLIYLTIPFGALFLYISLILEVIVFTGLLTLVLAFLNLCLYSIKGLMWRIAEYDNGQKSFQAILIIVYIIVAIYIFLNKV